MVPCPRSRAQEEQSRRLNGLPPATLCKVLCETSPIPCVLGPHTPTRLALDAYCVQVPASQTLSGTSLPHRGPRI